MWLSPEGGKAALSWDDGVACGRATLIQGLHTAPLPATPTPCSLADRACTEATTFSSKHIGVRLSPPLQEDSGFGATSFKWITCSAGGGADTTMQAMSLKRVAPVACTPEASLAALMFRVAMMLRKSASPCFLL